MIFGYNKNTDNLLQDNPTARGSYHQIQANMESYDTFPSFTASNAESATDYEMYYNMSSGKFEFTYSKNVTRNGKSL